MRGKISEQRRTHGGLDKDKREVKIQTDMLSGVETKTLVMTLGKVTD